MTAAVLIAVAATWALLVPIRSSCDVPFPQPNATLTCPVNPWLILARIVVLLAGLFAAVAAIRRSSGR